MQAEITKNVRYNFTVNILDATFFGLGLGFASFYTVIPLFISTLTDQTVLIGLAASIHTIGWQLPQLLTAGHVSRLRRYKRMVIFMTLHERWPFFGLALVAWLAPTLGSTTALWLALILISWHSFGGGFTATAWQSMIGKIMPPRRRGTFFGVQSAAANLLLSVGSITAGLILSANGSTTGFALCFLLAGIFMTLSLGFLVKSREPESPAPPLQEKQKNVTRTQLWRILRTDSNFRWFITARMLAQFAWMAVAFYTIYAVRRLGMDDQTAGLMAGILGITQTISNPILGWIGDQWGHRRVLAFGTLLATASIVLAIFAPNLSWFYLVFALMGLANPVVWAISMSFTLEFGEENERPLYIGLANTLIAPASIAAPLIGGWLADNFSFQATFMVAALCGLLTAFIIQFVVRDPRPQMQNTPQAAAASI